jgi:N4-gp56 family major capsid protein
VAITLTSNLTQEYAQLLSGELLLSTDSGTIFAALASAALREALQVPYPNARHGAGGFADAMLSIDRVINGDGVGRGFSKVVHRAVEPGTTVLVNRPRYFDAGPFSVASRTLTEGTAVSANSVPLAMDQVPVTIVEIAGPHDGSTVTPVGLSEFAADRARHDLVEQVGVALSKDRNRVVDTAIITELLTSTNQTLGTGFIGSAGGTTTPTMTLNGNLLTEVDLATAKRKLIERNAVPYPNGRFLAVIGPRHEENLRRDPLFREATRYAVQGGPLWSGYIGDYAGFSILLSNRLPTIAVGAAGAVTGYQAVCCGMESMLWAIGRDVEARLSDDTDFRRSLRWIWTALEGWKISNTAFVEKIVTS